MSCNSLPSSLGETVCARMVSAMAESIRIFAKSEIMVYPLRSWSA